VLRQLHLIRGVITSCAAGVEDLALELELDRRRRLQVEPRHDEPDVPCWELFTPTARTKSGLDTW